MRVIVRSVDIYMDKATIQFEFPDSRPGEMAHYRVMLLIGEAARLQALLLLAIADHANGATR